MRITQFDYPLPDALIAQYPAPARTDSRLLSLNGATGAFRELRFSDLLELLAPGDLLVLNDTRVLKARLLARKATGGRVELLIERILEAGRALALLRSNKPVRLGTVLQFGDATQATVAARQGDLYQLQFSCPQAVSGLLGRLGSMPLPPYIRRPAEPVDNERYQTVYARREGAVAAPTAGLHFDERLLRQLRERGIQQVAVTLHVGAGTFQPVRAEQVESHRLHGEYMEVSQAVCREIAAARARGGRVVAVGTTSVRALETAVRSGALRPFRGDTHLFIYPGFRFRCVDAMVTNFHLPCSTLLMLVCAFAGREQVLAAYRHAVRQRFRFYSYGDAMFVTRRNEP